jgi:hypothetical protein
MTADGRSLCQLPENFWKIDGGFPHQGANSTTTEQARLIVPDMPGKFCRPRRTGDENSGAFSAFLASTGQGLANVFGGVRGLTAGLPVVHFHFADPLGCRQGQSLQFAVADSNGDEGVVHSVPDPVLSRVNFFLDGLRALFEVTVKKLGVLHGQLTNEVPASPTGPLVVRLAPAFSLFPGQLCLARQPGKGIGDDVVVRSLAQLSSIWSSAREGSAIMVARTRQSWFP